jgi:hypothetical protein
MLADFRHFIFFDTPFRDYALADYAFIAATLAARYFAEAICWLPAATLIIAITFAADFRWP